MLIAFEGIDNAGKTTIFERLKTILDPERFTFCGEFDSPVADQVKTLLKDGASDFLKTYFFATDRAWTYEKIALPALESGRIVIWDRYLDSAFAYRTASFRLGKFDDMCLVKNINAPFRAADCTFYFDIAVDLSLQRSASSSKFNPYSREILSIVKNFYDEKAARDCSYIKIDASMPCAELVNIVKDLINNIT